MARSEQRPDERMGYKMKLTLKIYVDERPYYQDDEELNQENSLEFVQVGALTAQMAQVEDFPDKAVVLHVLPEYGKGLFMLRFGPGIETMNESALNDFINAAWPKHCAKNGWKF